MLGTVESLEIASVLEDCVDQLSVLGHIMPVSYSGARDADQLVKNELSVMMAHQKALEARYEQLVHSHQGRGGTGAAHTAPAVSEQRNVAAELKNTATTLSRGLRHNPLTSDNMTKVQQDRGFLEGVVSDTLQELLLRGSYQTLIDAVREEKSKKEKLQHTILKEEQGRMRVRQLQQQLKEVKKEREEQVQQRNEMIAHLKDQLQEMKAKTSMEGKYIKKCAEVSVSQTQKRCTLQERELKDEIEKLKVAVDDESRSHVEIDQYLRRHTAELNNKADEWMRKYEKDVEAKQKELDLLKGAKAKDLERLQELTKLYAEYEQVVVEDRIEKEKARRKMEMEAEELKAAVMMQSWFRGVMVRKALGPYGKKKKKKGGKKGKKKK